MVRLKDIVLDSICSDLERIREQHPLVHNITNYVVMNFTANILLSLGASPVMAHAPEEIDEMVGLANALVVNIGTLSTQWVNSMFQAAIAARNRSLPVVFDPVGAGATRFRTEVARDYATRARPAIIRGNASEILAVAGRSAQTKGVDSAHKTKDAATAAESLALEYGAVAAVTGPEDFITDGKRRVQVMNGHPLMGRVTGTGCAATAIMGAFCAVEPDPFIAAIGALTTFGVAGELAAKSNPGPGTYQVLLLDALDAVSADVLRERARIGSLASEEL